MEMNKSGKENKNWKEKKQKTKTPQECKGTSHGG